MNQTTYSNPSLKQALENMRANQTHETMLKTAEALLNTKVMAPARWDKQPETDAHGALKFSPDTKITLLVVADKEGKKYFPMFTSIEEVKKFYGDATVNALILSLDQYLPFLTSAKGEVEGMVVDPKGINVPFKTDFLEGIHKASKARLNQNTIHKGDKVLLKNPPKGIEDLEAAIISAGYHEPSVRAIYLKERVEDPEHPEKTHWFVVIDSDQLDTGIFSRLGIACKDVCHGKAMEFMFADQKLGKDIAKSSAPIFNKAA